METSATSGLPSELGIAIASGFVPASFLPPSGGPSRSGEVAVSAAEKPSARSFARVPSAAIQRLYSQPVRVWLALAAGLAIASTASARATRHVVETARSGVVQAEFSYNVQAPTTFSRQRLTITRG